MKKPFYETIWSKVKAGDVALVAHADEISRVTVKEIRHAKLEDGAEAALVYYRFRYAHYHVTFGANGTVYVQSRL